MSLLKVKPLSIDFLGNPKAVEVYGHTLGVYATLYTWGTWNRHKTTEDNVIFSVVQHRALVEILKKNEMLSRL